MLCGDYSPEHTEKILIVGMGEWSRIVSISEYHEVEISIEIEVTN